MKLFFKSVIADVVITVILLSVAVNFFAIFKWSTKRGFFCDDESLKYPYRTDTVDSTMLYILSVYIPATIMCIGESVLFLFHRKRSTVMEYQGFTDVLQKLHHNLIPFLCGFAMQAILVHTTKITLGRLRPHFFDVCQPYRRLDGSTCDNPKNHGIYIEDYECMPSMLTNQRVLKGVHISFPSGHASYIFYGMTFTILYLQRFSKTVRQYGINVGLFMLVVQMFCVLLAWLVAVSRVMDYKHHWSDVLVGIVLGTSVATAVSVYVCQQLESVNIWPKGVKSSNSVSTSSMSFSTSMPNPILVP